MAEPDPIRVEGLTVRYGDRIGVEGLSIEVRRGEIYGLLGSNGAGKSTTIRALVGLLPPDAGTARVFGLDPIDDGVAAKRRFGYVPETPLLFDALTPREFVEFVAGVRGLPNASASERLGRFADAFQLGRELDQPIAVLSSGTRQKVLLVAALLHRPPLLILDEPFHSLDPRTVRIARELLQRHVSEGGGAVLLSTHTMEVAERLCHRVGILDHGRLVGEGTVAELGGGREGDLEAAFLRLTREEAAVEAAVRSLGAG